MTLSDLSSLATLVSGVAVLVSLFYLAQQIRQNTKHSQALIQQGRADRVAEMAMRWAEFRAEDDIECCFQGDPDADPRSLIRFLSIYRAWMAGIEDSYYHQQEGLMNERAIASADASLRGTLSRTPGMAAAWLMTRALYAPDFQDYMDRILDGIASEDGEAGRTSRWKAAVEAWRQKSTRTRGENP